MTNDGSYVLGLDLGVSSLGWAVVDLDTAKKNRPFRIRDTGVRIFEAGVEGVVEQGKDSSRAVQRRQARQPRCQHWRRQHRKQKLFRLLGQHGLFPPSESDSAADRKAVLDQLDAELTARHIPDGDHLAHQKLPYLLRAKASRDKLEPYELGRALYHLAQRRGFLSNRKDQDDDEPEGKVAGGISEIDQAKGDKTLGQFFSEDVDVFAHRTKPDSDDRDAKTGRIRRRYTARQMYKEEFDAIRKTQSPHFARIDDKAWKAIENAIFFQRPLNSQRHLIGRCSLEPARRRCPEALPIYQEFRVLQQVNHLMLRLPDGSERPLNENERRTLINALSQQGEMKCSAARKLIKAPKQSAFSIEEWEPRLVGHKTNARMVAVFDERWHTFSPEEQEQIVLDVLYYVKPEALARRAMKQWGLDRDSAQLLSRTRLEEGYAAHCNRALRKLLERMRNGMPYGTARRELYPDQFAADNPLDVLPPVYKWNRDLRNPAVHRALTELRKVITALVHKYGKPARIHIELARELKASRDTRKRRWKIADENRKRLEKAVKEIFKETGIEKPARRDVDKWLLAEECGWVCPYSGIAINGRSLLSSHPEFDIEHIYPRKYLDDSFRNKTLCHVAVNRDRKRDLLPSQAFSGSDYETILDRVARFTGPHAAEKLRRFKMEQVPEDFVSRDLNDTRYNATLAAEYVATLYGGRVDVEGKKRVHVPTGGLTWMLRNGWLLNGILSTENKKTRDDHRHHAVDALIVAMTDDARVKALEEAAQDAAKKESRAFLRAMKLPWKSFFEEAGKAIHSINVSHRPTRTISGPLHAESIYSKPHHNSDGTIEYRIRKELHKLNEKEIAGDQIVDPAVRAAVQEKYKQLKAENPRARPAQLWSNKDDVDKFPVLKAKTGHGPGTPVFKVRLRVDARPRAIGRGVRERNVVSGKDSNYASMIYALLDGNGAEKKWIHEIITRLEAHERLSANRRKRGEKVLIPDEQDGKRRFLFSLVKNDMLMLEGPDGDDVLYRVASLSADEIQLIKHNRSRLEKTDRTRWNRIRTPDTLRKRNARKVHVSPLGHLLVNTGC